VFNKSDTEYVLPEYIKLFVNKVYEISDVSAEKKKVDDEAASGRRLRESRSSKLEFDSKYFLHSLGYNLFNMHNLTYAEVHELVDAHNRDIEKKNAATKSASKK